MKAVVLFDVYEEYYNRDTSFIAITKVYSRVYTTGSLGNISILWNH